MSPVLETSTNISLISGGTVVRSVEIHSVKLSKKMIVGINYIVIE